MQPASSTSCPISDARERVHRIDLERKVVQHCAPTLAGLKPANLFVFRDLSVPGICPNRTRCMTARAFERGFSRALAQCRAKLAPCGVRIEMMARRRSGMLLYAYRPALLATSLQHANTAAYLAREGYDTSSLHACVTRLKERICGTDAQSEALGCCSFPHEIGFFLGYPYDDVIGFIENEGENYLCNGCWKVYSKERDARECFLCYKECTKAYQGLYDNGVPIEHLAMPECSPEPHYALRFVG